MATRVLMTPCTTGNSEMKMIYEHNQLAAQMRGDVIPAVYPIWEIVMAAFNLAGGYTDRLGWDECHFSKIERDGDDVIFVFASAPSNHIDRTEFQVLFDNSGRGRIWREGEPRPWPHPRKHQFSAPGC